MRMTNARPLWPLLTAALIGLPALYVASVGPIYWLIWNERTPSWCYALQWEYERPLRWTYSCGPDWWRETLDRYVKLWQR